MVGGREEWEVRRMDGGLDKSTPGIAYNKKGKIEGRKGGRKR